MRLATGIRESGQRAVDKGAPATIERAWGVVRRDKEKKVIGEGDKKSDVTMYE